jgi:hypothetical protein
MPSPITSKLNSKRPGNASTTKTSNHAGTAYERQHELHREAKRYAALAHDPKLSPDAAAAARKMLHGARKARALMDHLVVGIHFPDSMSHHWRNAHGLIAQLRRDGDDSPEHVERMLKLARQAGAFVDRGDKGSDQARKSAKQTKSPNAPRGWYS